ncbi:hypothetical protein [Pseudorhodobacter sp.]|uniref:hypothetical protein n=1 Tax=Pseudorhodobacter sp. TaxID=1934400 RepID=UPI002647E2DE|nr:hypothetical protein [Pseudorhodobacter sp.]MDN5785690.1 hypothetical protein [Pseudorhodobacter sp.]
MTLIRPEVRGGLWRWREVIVAIFMALLGLWLMALGGFLLMPLGAVLAVVATGFGVLSWRRLRFAQSGEAPGIVELLEGQISYFGPNIGGSVALREMTELRLITAQGRRMWRLKQSDGQALLIPVGAQGAEGLFDAFAALPGMDTGALVAALAPPSAAGKARALVVAADTRVIWRHPARAVLT